MKHARVARTAGSGVVWMLLVTAFAVQSAFAQNGNEPAANAATAKPATAVQVQTEKWVELEKECANLNKDDPKTTIAKYKHFWEENADLTPTVAVSVCAAVARIYHDDLKDSATALSTCDFGIRQYKTSRDRIRLVAYKASILAERNRPLEALALVDANWSLMLTSDPIYTKQMLEVYTPIMQQQSKTGDEIDKLTATFRRLPIYFGDEAWSPGEPLYTELIDLLVEERQFDAALSWAKLRLMLCPYKEEPVANAFESVRNLVDMEAIPDGSGANSATSSPGTSSSVRLPEKDAASLPRVFGVVTEPDTPDQSADRAVAKIPVTKYYGGAVQAKLRAVSFPAAGIDLDAIQKKLLVLGRASAEDRIERITLYLLCGKYHDAMVEAQRFEKEAPDSPIGPGQVARVFKAADMDVVRANAYLDYHRDKKGEDPTILFLKQFPADEPTGGGN